MTETTAEQVLQELLECNRRFAEGCLIHPRQTVARRLEIAQVQRPKAVVVTCSDARVVPLLIFDQGLGDLFVVRVAGNITVDVVHGSIEYAVEHLGVNLVVILGHSSCGAVTATVSGGKTAGQISSFVNAIQPAVDKVRDHPGDTVDNAARANVGMIVEQLKTSEPILMRYLDKGSLKIVGAYYSLTSGLVEVIC
ncbi:MAG: carbonic anhydrase [candidate division Zixibacteria bacterium]|nr:carbonic anhydrase [candidate division Zixibacteria bacterium]MDD5425289.1 carbonic anhydrase [candidate division Zixibacteria bacterium]